MNTTEKPLNETKEERNKRLVQDLLKSVKQSSNDQLAQQDLDQIKQWYALDFKRK